ncbi:hypothetical protein [Homoserinibacter gongjuensis]|uniref:Uncharacterized protein n=1 Tax=Homoserinibacter gongjuensis TaxID=1162968 RepID=A0ABQ6JXN3_9MICO|nr:hypothetical protein [Homoserinibacter gongjuensis]GMA93075.1 hypothetical protein GCM10025869_36040 [Homoserinibacter gongjuensis]
MTAALMDVDDDGELLEDEVDLFEMLAVESISRVRLVKLRSPAQDSHADEQQDDASDIVSRYVAHSIPQLHPSASNSTDAVELIRMSLICTPTQVQLDERLRGAENDSSVVVVASPEDRATPSAGDAFVRENERFDGFVLMHVATLAGLWRGTPIGTLEMFERESSAAQSIWIQRVFVRGVLTKGIARRAAAEVLERLIEHRGSVAAAGVTVTPQGTAVIPAERVPLYIDKMLEAAVSLDDSALAFRPPQIDREPDRESVGVWQQLGMFARFSGGKLARIPHWTWLWFHDLFARGVAKELQGADGYRQVALLLDQEPDAMDRRLLLSIERLQAPATPTGAPLSVMAPTDHVAPRLWAGLRKLIFSAVDGSANLDETFSPIDGRVPVFDSLDPIAPDPRGGWEHPSPPRGFPARVTWADIRRDDSLRNRLLAVVQAAAARRDAARVEHAQAASAAEAIKSDLATVQADLLGEGMLKARSDGRVVAAKPAKDASTEVAAAHSAAVREWQGLQARMKAASAEVESAASRFNNATLEVEQATAHLASFDDWVAEQAATFTARLSNRMGAAREAAALELALAERAGTDLPELRELVRLRKAFHRGVLVASLVIGVVMGFVIALPSIAMSELGRLKPELSGRVREAFEQGDYPDWWAVVLVGLGLLLVILIFLLVAYYRGWSVFARRVQLADFAVATRALRARALRGEMQRLESLHEQAEQWVDLVSTALFDPWEIPREWREASSSGLDASRMPFAMGIGEAVEGVARALTASRGTPQRS